MGKNKTFYAKPALRMDTMADEDYKPALLMAILAWTLTYVPLLFDYWSALAASTLFFYLTIPFWHRILTKPGRHRAIPLIYLLLVYTFLIALRAVEAVLWGQKYEVYVLEKTPGFMLLVLLTLAFGTDSRENGYRKDLLLDREPEAALIAYGATSGYAAYAIADIVVSAKNMAVNINAPSLALISLWLVVNSFFEEYLFRGLLYTTLSERLGVVKGGFIAQCLLFGAWHLVHHLDNPMSTYSIIHISGTIFYALIATTYRYLGGSIEYPILVHTYINVLSELQPISGPQKMHNVILTALFTAIVLALALRNVMKTGRYRDALTRLMGATPAAGKRKT